MLKINLSGKKKEKQQEIPEQSFEETGESTVEETSVQDAQQDDNECNAAPNRNQNLLKILLVVLAVAALVYLQKDRLLGLFGGSDEPVQQVVAPPPAPAPAPAPEEAKKEPDPTFVAINGISEVIPPKAWLTSVIVMFDGTYEIKGIAFSHDSINPMITSLGLLGEIAAKDIPSKSKSPETRYTFTISGVLSDITVPEILDIIPADKLAALAEPVQANSKNYGVAFTRSPKVDATYGENDLPFALEGSYQGLKQVIADLCPEGGAVKVYRLTIDPSTPGRPFDRVRASFSLRTTSSI